MPLRSSDRQPPVGARREWMDGVIRGMVGSWRSWGKYRLHRCGRDRFEWLRTSARMASSTFRSHSRTAPSPPPLFRMRPVEEVGAAKLLARAWTSARRPGNRRMGRRRFIREQGAKQLGVPEQMLVANVVGANMLACRGTHPVGKRRIVEQRSYCTSERGQVRWVRQQKAGAVGDLVLDASYRGADDRPALPHALGYGEAEALGEALLYDHAGVPLQRVDHCAVVVDVCHRQRHQHHAGPLP